MFSNAAPVNAHKHKLRIFEVKMPVVKYIHRQKHSNSILKHYVYESGCFDDEVYINSLYLCAILIQVRVSRVLGGYYSTTYDEAPILYYYTPTML